MLWKSIQPSSMGPFIPRIRFHAGDALPRSYFLGHHQAGLSKMKTMLSYIDLVIECRDYRVPLISCNPLFEENLGGRERLIVYTKQDLGSEFKQQDRDVCSKTKKLLKTTVANVMQRGSISSNNGKGPRQFFFQTTKIRSLFAKCSSSFGRMRR